MYIFHNKSYFYKMEIKNNVKTLLASIVLLSFFWITFIITKQISKDSEDKNELFIPKSAIFAAKLDAKKLANKAFFSILFEEKDDKIIKKLRETLSKQSDTNPEMGINFLSDLVVFSSPYKNGKVLGVTVNLTNSEHFTKNVSELLGKEQLLEVVDNVGIILTYVPNTTSSKINKKELKNYFEKEIQPLSENSTSRFPELNAKNTNFLQSFSNGKIFGTSTCFTSTDVAFNLIGNGIGFNGDLLISQDKFANVYAAPKILSPKAGNFHFSSGIIPKSLQDSLCVYAKKIGINLPKLKSISMNYGGLGIQNDENGMKILPDIDLLLEFTTAFSLSDVLKNDTLLEKIGGEFQDDKLKIGGKIYYISQLDAKTVSLSALKTPAIVANKRNELFAVKGNLSTLLKIEGGGMIVSFLEIVPAYRASKELFNNIDNVNVTIVKSTPKNAKLNGLVNFKKDHSAMTEMIKFLLEIQFILM